MFHFLIEKAKQKVEFCAYLLTSVFLYGIIIEESIDHCDILSEGASTQMKHIVKALVCIMLASVLLFAVVACSDTEKSGTDFPNTQSGFEFELSEAVLDISQSFKLKKESAGYIPGAEVNISVSGNDVLSYFDGVVTFVWDYEFLNDDGEYEAASYKTAVELDATGKGSLKEKIDFDEHRSVRNIELSLSFKGFAVKK